LISERSAGTLRYLDSDPEEQRRGITMRSSAIGLRHEYAAPGGKKKQQQNNSTNGESSGQRMIVHLVDSPGHSDFSAEVSSSMLACDGAILIVDAVEGMGARTQQVFRETALYQLTPVLVVNKLDRLRTDLGLTPTEAYLRLRSLLETVNSATAAMVNSMSTTTTTTSAADATEEEVKRDDDNHYMNKEKLEQLWTFDPAAGNVIFASALFGIGFTVPGLCRSLFRSGAVKVKPIQLRHYLFGDFKLKQQDDESKVLKWKQQSTDLPLFAEFALQPIWDIFEGIAVAAATVGLNGSNTAASSGKDGNAKIRADTVGMDQVLTALQTGATAPAGQASLSTPEDLQSVLTRTGAGSNEEATLRAILRRYRPLSDAVLDVVCEYCPSPSVATAETRIRALALQDPTTTTTAAMDDFVRIREAVRSCNDGADAPVVAHVCKFLSTDQHHVRDAELEQRGDAGNKNRNIILGLARVLSGRLRSNTAYHLFGPRHAVSLDDTTPAGNDPTAPPLSRKIRLYLLMGSSFIRVEEVPAGHLCAIYGLEDVQLKSVTLSDSPYCEPLRGFHVGMRPLVKVSIEPEKTADAEYLERGLAKLSLADGAVEISATDKGERLLACLGELHLEQSVLDLERIYCEKEGIKLKISDPIVDFAETTDWFETMNEIENYAAFYENKLPRLRHTTMPPYNEEEGIAHAKHGRTRAILHGKSGAIHLRVVPLARSVFKSLQQGSIFGTDNDDSAADCRDELLKLGRALNCRVLGGDKLTAEAVLEDLKNLLVSIDANGNALVESAGLRDGSCVRAVVADGVYIPPAPLQDNKSVTEKKEDNYEDEDEIDNASSPAVVQGVDEYVSLRTGIRDGGLSARCKHSDTSSLAAADKAALEVWTKAIRGSVVAGFQNALRSGPICEEPMRNILVVLEGVEVAIKQTGSDSFQASKPFAGGMVVSTLRSGIRCALLSRPARLMEGHLKLTLHSSLTGLGPLYQVLSKRRGKVIEDSMVDGTDLLMITAMIPQAEAFGLTPELFAKTSGEVTAPEMLFSHWGRLDVDPFWIPTSEEEREDFGEVQTTGDSSTGLDNPALKYIRQVRKRKGLTVDSSRTVLNAEKQRTLKK